MGLIFLLALQNALKWKLNVFVCEDGQMESDKTRFVFDASHTVMQYANLAHGALRKTSNDDDQNTSPGQLKSDDDKSPTANCKTLTGDCYVILET